MKLRKEQRKASNRRSNKRRQHRDPCPLQTHMRPCSARQSAHKKPGSGRRRRRNRCSSLSYISVQLWTILCALYTCKTACHARCSGLHFQERRAASSERERSIPEKTNRVQAAQELQQQQQQLLALANYTRAFRGITTFHVRLQAAAASSRAAKLPRGCSFAQCPLGNASDF